MSSGSGGGPQFAPNVFQPPNQGAAAQGWQSLLQPITNQGLAQLNTFDQGGTPFGLAWPLIQSAAFNQYANPYGNQMLAGTTNAADFFNSQVPGLYQQAASIPGQAGPYATAGAGFLANVGNAAANQYPQVLNAANSPNYAAGGAAGLTALNTAMDPQSALFNQMQHQLLDQSTVANSIAGLGSSPYAASVTSNALGNQALQWQNNLLQRQQQGIQSALAPANAAVLAQSQGAGALSNLANATRYGYGGALDLLGQSQNMFGSAAQGLTNAATGINQFNALPYQGYQGLTGNQLGSVQNLIGLGNAGYNLPNQAVTDLAQYLNLGINASNTAGTNASINNQIGSTNFNQLAGGLGGAQQLLFGNSLGNSGGLLGGLSGLGGSSAPMFDAATQASIADVAAGGMGAADVGGGGDAALGLLGLPFGVPGSF